MSNRILTAQSLRELLHYDPETGVFTRRVSTSNSVKVGQLAGHPDKEGYLKVSVLNTDHKAHRLAWLYLHDSWPDGDIDHINGVKWDNREANLRVATRSENLLNRGMSPRNTSGFKGVTWDKHAGKWKAATKRLGKSIHLGLYETAELAHESYCRYARINHGDFFRSV